MLWLVVKIISTTLNDYDYDTKKKFVEMIKSLRPVAEIVEVSEQNMSIVEDTKIPI